MPKRRADDYDFHSGSRRRKREDRKQRQLYILLAAVAVVAVVCSGVGAIVLSAVKHVVQAARINDEPDEAGPPVAKVTAEDLCRLYDRDEDRADRRYLSQSIQVDGVVASVEKQPDSGWRVALTTGPTHARIHGWFDARHGAIVSRLAIGQKCSIIGICDGKEPDPNVRGAWTVSLGSCRLAE
jgi:hypothetical protein